MEDLLGLIIWIVIIVASISKNKKKKAQKQAQKAAKKAAANPWEQALSGVPGEVAEVIRTAVKNVEARKSAQPAAQQLSMPLTHAMPAAPLGSIVPLAPTVHTHFEPDCATHDTPGSLGTVSTEGKDPCHAEQFAPLTEPMPEAAPQPGLRLNFVGENLMQAFVMQEVLTRPCDRRRSCAR